MEDEKKSVIELIKQQIFDDYNRFSKDEQCRYLKIIEEFVDDLYNQNKPIIIPLNKKYTSYARRYFCSVKTRNDIFKINYSVEYSANKKQIINYLISIIKQYVLIKGNTLSGDYRQTMNSMYASDNYQKYSNLPLGYLNFHISTLAQFVNIRCYQISDILSYTIAELNQIFDYSTIVKSIVAKYNSIGLQFADNLSISETKKVISMYSDDIILNSSIGWINKQYDISEDTISYRKYKTIGDLVRSINLPQFDVSLTYLQKLKEMGLDFKEINDKIQRTDNTESNYNVLNLDIYSLPIKSQTKNALYREGIRDIKTLISYTKNDIAHINRISIESAGEIEQLIHSFGLSLKEEENTKHR